MQLFRIIFLLAKLQNKKETAKQFPYFISTSAAKLAPFPFGEGWGEASHIYSPLKVRHFWGKSSLLLV